MFNIGFTEMLVIAGLALILIGPKQLPEVARSLGRLLNELKRSADVLKDEFNSQVGSVTDDIREERVKLGEADKPKPAERIEKSMGSKKMFEEMDELARIENEKKLIKSEKTDDDKSNT